MDPSGQMWKDPATGPLPFSHRGSCLVLHTCYSPSPDQWDCHLVLSQSSGTRPDAILAGTLPLLSQPVNFSFLSTAMDLLAFLAQTRHALYVDFIFFALVWKALPQSLCLPFLSWIHLNPCETFFVPARTLVF